jgi:hypothetical protein
MSNPKKIKINLRSSLKKLKFIFVPLIKKKKEKDERIGWSLTSVSQMLRTYHVGINGQFSKAPVAALPINPCFGPNKGLNHRA